MQKQKKKPSLIPSLISHKALTHISKKFVPELKQFYHYDCELVVQQYHNQYGEVSQISFLYFTHKINSTTFTINITDVSYSLSAAYQLQWREAPNQQTYLNLADPIGISLAVNCLDYNKPNFNPQFAPNFEEVKIQTQKDFSFYQFEGSSKNSRIKRQQMREAIKIQELKQKRKKEKKQSQYPDFDQIKKQQSQNFSDFGSDFEDIQIPKKIQTVFQKQRIVNEYKIPEEKNLIDYCESLKNMIRLKLIDFFRIPQNRKKKPIQIKQYFRRNNYNVPDKPLKQLIADICINPVMDKVRGYLVKQIYLNQEERNQRRYQQMKIKQEMMEKDRKKRGKKESKKQSSITPQQSQFLQTKAEHSIQAEQQQLQYKKPTKQRRSSKKQQSR